MSPSAWAAASRHCLLQDLPLHLHCSACANRLPGRGLGSQQECAYSLTRSHGIYRLAAGPHPLQEPCLPLKNGRPPPPPLLRIVSDSQAC